MATVTFQVSGMSCGGCAKSIERRLLATPSVRTASADHVGKSVTAEYDPASIGPEKLAEAISALGFEVAGTTCGE
jgi:copper chaperone CopZ